MFFWPPRRSGLTLIEVLVVVAILAILLAILWPAIMRMRAIAERQEDVENLRVLGQAWLAYTRAHNGKTLDHKTSDPNDRWIKKLDNYYDNLDTHLVSPGDPRKNDRYQFMADNPTRKTSSYVLNPYFSTLILDPNGNVLSCERLSDCSALSRAMAIVPVSTTAGVPGPGYIFPQGWFVSPLSMAWSRVTGRFGVQPDRFFGSSPEPAKRYSNYFYADGHVDSVTVEKMQEWVNSGVNFLIPEK
jgi:prepilin-type N-terminal cleavage/methylation domain-containing protein/prepilin-type processing-associated H-X9-DG protein